VDTCAKEPGSFCQFLTANITGSAPWCLIFDEFLYDGDHGVRGWLLRCKQCKESEAELLFDSRRGLLKRSSDFLPGKVKER
jgi:hypothetical protein